MWKFITFKTNLTITVRFEIYYLKFKYFNIYSFTNKEKITAKLFRENDFVINN